MIDFRLTETDKAHIAQWRNEALLCRKHARYYDEHEAEMPPDRLDEADDYYAKLEKLPEGTVETPSASTKKLSSRTFSTASKSLLPRLNRPM